MVGTTNERAAPAITREGSDLLTPSFRDPPPHTARPISRPALVAATVIVSLVVVLICLIPKPENDLFFILRIGSDIVASHKLPHVDTYSWVNRGTEWDPPEWLAFVLYAVAFRTGAFFGTWLLMTAASLAGVLIVWFWVAQRLGLVRGFLLTNLVLLATSDYIQERPYVFTYILLPVSLVLLLRARADIAEGKPFPWKRIAVLSGTAVLWANLHPGVVAFCGIVAIYACGDAVLSFLKPGTGNSPLLSRAVRAAAPMAGTALACAVAAMVSPYGWHIYRTIAITVGDKTMMSNVTEWMSIAVLPFTQMDSFLVLVAVTALAFTLSRRPNRLPDALVLAVLLTESLLHARNIPLFAIAAGVVGAVHAADAIEQWRPDSPVASQPNRPAERSGLWVGAIAFVGVLYVLAVALVAAASLSPAIGRRGYSVEGIAEAVARVPSYPDDACAFVLRERFPAHLRIFNNFALGGYLMWRLPSEPVFIDGRLDVYTGRTFDNMLILARPKDIANWKRVAGAYDFDCAITSTDAVVHAFERDPDWQLVYDPGKRPGRSDCRVLLRRRPQFLPLIDRCLRDRKTDSHRSIP